MGTAVDDFLAEMLPKQVAAETAIHNGDVEPRLALWSRTDPVTVFGAKRSATLGRARPDVPFGCVLVLRLDRLQLRGCSGGRQW